MTNFSSKNIKFAEIKRNIYDHISNGRHSDARHQKT